MLLYAIPNKLCQTINDIVLFNDNIFVLWGSCFIMVFWTLSSLVNVFIISMRFLWWTFIKLSSSSSDAGFSWSPCPCNHGILIQTEIICNKISCYIRDSAYRWFIVKKAKIFWICFKHFWILADVRKCKILNGLCK